MCPKGIHNPFEKPKKDLHTLYDDPPIDTEHDAKEPPTITLDGDSYQLKFVNATIEDVPDRLYELLYDVNLEHSSGLQANGVYINIPDKDMPTLTTEAGTISVHTIEDGEVVIFRRIAYALKSLPVQRILKKHSASIIERA